SFHPGSNPSHERGLTWPRLTTNVGKGLVVWQTIEIVRLTFALASETLVERAEIDHHSLMSSGADLFNLVARRHLELNSLAFDLDHLGFGTNSVANRRCGKVPYIYFGADRALTQL